MKKTLLVIALILGSLFILVKACQTVVLKDAIKTNKEISQLDTNTVSENPPKEYLNLFRNKKALKCISTITSKHRYLITEFTDGQFDIQISKLDTMNSLQVSQVLNETFSTTEQSKNIYYTDYLPNKIVSINYRLGAKEKIDEVYFTLYGDNTRILKKDDTVAYYYSNFENFSIKYQKEGKIDIYGKAKGNSQGSKAPLEVMFLKRNNNFYLILLTNKIHSSNLDLYALYNLIYN